MRKLTEALALILALLICACALAEEITAAPVEEAIGEITADLFADDAESDLAAPERDEALDSAVLPTPGSLVTITKPANGSTVAPGDVELWCRFDSSVFNGTADEWKFAMIAVEVLRDGERYDAQTISVSGTVYFVGDGRQYATLSLTQPGEYTIRASVPGSADVWDSVTVTVSDVVEPDPDEPDPVEPDPDTDNPGYYVDLEESEYTINLAEKDTVRVNFSLSCYRYEKNAGFSSDDALDAGGETIARCAGWPERDDLQWREENGAYVADAWFDFQGVKVGTGKTTVAIIVVINGKPYGEEKAVTINVIDDPSLVPTPTAAPTATPKASAKPTAAPTATPKATEKPAVPTATPKATEKPTAAPTAIPEATEKPAATTTATAKPTDAPMAKPVSLKGAKVTVKDKTYTGKALKPSVTVKLNGVMLKKGTDYTVRYSNNKAVGKATVKITGKGGYTGTVKGSFRINPKKVSGLKLKAGVKQLTASWKKASGVSGYQLQYSLKKSFAGAKTKTAKKTATQLKLGKLKAGKTYYVRIRAYKTVKGKRYYSAWSKAVKKKTR